MIRPSEVVARHGIQEAPEVKLDRMIDELKSRDNGRKAFGAVLRKANGEHVEVIMTGAMHREGSPIQLVHVLPGIVTGYPSPSRIVVIDAAALTGA